MEQDNLVPFEFSESINQSKQATVTVTVKSQLQLHNLNYVMARNLDSLSGKREREYPRDKLMMGLKYSRL
jgi:hypothetical protein